MFSIDLRCDYYFVIGLSVSLTFLLSVLISLMTLLVARYLCIHGRKKKTTPSVPTSSHEFCAGSGTKGIMRTLPNAAYGEIQPQSTANSHIIYDEPILASSTWASVEDQGIYQTVINRIFSYIPNVTCICVVLLHVVLFRFEL